MSLMMDGSMDTDESKTSIGEREGWGEGKMRRGKGTKESHGHQCFQFVLLIVHGEGKHENSRKEVVTRCG